MASLNKVMLIGYLGKDPEYKQISETSAVCKFSIATSKTWVDNGKRQEKTEWHNIVVWNRGTNKAADNAAKFLVKGKRVYVEGEISTRSWDDKESGQKRHATDIVANTVTYLDSATKSEEQGKPQNGGWQPPKAKTDDMKFPAPHHVDEPVMSNFDYDSIPF